MIKKYLFRLFYFFPIRKSKIVFIAHSGNRLDCNPKAIFETLIKKNKNYKYIWILSEKFHEKYKQKYPKVEFVTPKSLKAFYHLSTCQVFVNNQIHVYYKQMGFKKRPEQLYLQTWHGSFGMKHVAISDNIATVHKACADMDYWITNSSFESNVYRKTFDLNAKFCEIGHARSDFLFLKHESKIHHYYDIKDDVKIILYAPTKRESQSDCFILDFEKTLKLFQMKFKEKFVILVRMHRNMALRISQNKNMIDAFDYPDVMELIQECDILISDYSSIICDFALTRKPIFIYAKDYDSFLLTSKLYHDYHQLPFGLAKNFQDLEKNVQNFDYYIYKDKLNKWLDEVGCIEDGKAAQKISLFIEQFINKDKDINCYTNHITPYIAKIIGFKKIYFTFRNIGDQIIMMRALEILHQKTKEIFLIGTTLPELWKEVSYVKVITLLEVKLHIYQKEQFTLMSSYGIKPIFLTQESFVKNKKGYIRTYGPSHIVANVCSKLGLDGDIVVDLNLPLSEKEKKIGRFISKDKKQIAIISGGLQRYKTYPFEKLQQVVDVLKEKYEFIQIGVKSDLPLRGALDLRGKLNLREVASTLYNSDLFLGGIGGLMHMANAVGCPSVVLYSEAEPDYIVHYNNNIDVYPFDNPCKKCTEGTHCPWTSLCKKEGVKYTCIDYIQIEDIVKAVDKRISMPKNLNIPTIYNISSNKVYGLEEQKKVGFKFQTTLSSNDFFGYKKYKENEKKVFMISIFYTQPFSVLWAKKYLKIRFLNFHISYDNFKIEYRLGKKEKALKNNLLLDIGRVDFIKGYNQYYNQFLKLRNHLDGESLFLLNYIMQKKKSDEKSIEPHLEQKIALEKRDKLLNLNHSAGKVYFEGNPLDIFLYNQYVSFIPVTNSYALIHKCFIDEKYSQYYKNCDIIDIGIGNGMSSLCLSEYTNKKVHAIEAAENIFNLFKEVLKLNEKECKIIPYHLAIGSKKSSLYITNQLNNSNKTSLEKRENSCFIDTLDNFIQNNHICPKFINIWINGDEYDCLIGAQDTIKKYRPILHINMSKSADFMFKILNFAISKCLNYNFEIKKTTEPHLVSEIFLIAVPKEII
ncbi:FkbM family methyltransferase [Campylobacter sp. RM10543]|uniref:FkbM family methyltransferase n=1 Tax=Campylobacter molothri TaxID=1032242 RepID=UPI00301E0693|nr:FkbM family methyltransferase [Campylobacter sp. RM10543]